MDRNRDPHAPQVLEYLIQHEERISIQTVSLILYANRFFKKTTFSPIASKLVDKAFLSDHEEIDNLKRLACCGD